MHRCLDVLLSQQTSYTFEIIVVNQEPLQESILLQPRYAQIRWLNNSQKKNPYTSRNIGIHEARGSYIAFLDAQCQPNPDWLEHLLSSASSDKILAGQYHLKYASDRLQDKVYGILYLNTKRNVENGYGVTMANILVPKRLFQDQGLFQDDIASGNDIAWSRKALKAGYDIIYIEKAGVSYPAQSWEVLTQKVVKYAQGSAHQARVENFQKSNKWRMFMPMRPSNFNDALKQRDLQDLSYLDQMRLWMMVWQTKVRYARHYK